uniref:Uncharacterized protein LOC102801936 n=1 Tax=Saccoglossus kowalevskii TaxID=10224 RepID=A0ABM0M4L4_SACKO|nr:PREDICTED: uncharacterized protein LOC102801936 [Saccoglossus kowalevskii]
MVGWKWILSEQAFMRMEVVITSLKLQVAADAQLIEGLVQTQNKFKFDVIATYDDTTTAISGKDLWRLNAFGSKSAAAKGKKQSLVRQAFNDAQGSTSLTLGSPLMFDDVEMSIDMTSLLCHQVTHVCAELFKNPKSDPEFEFSAATNKATKACAEVPCAGVIVTDNNIAVEDGTVLKENNPNNPISLDISYDSLVSGSTIFGNKLWDLSLSGNTRPDGTGDAILIDDQALTSSQRDIPFAAGTTMTFSDVQVNVDLTGKKCAEIPYICATLSKGRSPSRDFTLSGLPDESVFTACTDYIACETGCPDPRAAIAGHVKVPEKSFYSNDDVFIVCEEGYMLNGVLNLICNSDGTWSDPLPTCDKLECPDPRQGIPGHIVVPKETFHAGDRIDFTCDSGYQLVGSPILTCNDDGTLSGEPPVCDKIECADPRQGIPGHIDVDEETFVQGDLIKFECTEGYDLVGADTLACNDDGSWSGPLPDCIKRKKVRVTGSDIAPRPGTKIFEDSPDNPVEIDASFPTDPKGDDASTGDNLWNLDTWLSNDPEGYGPRLSENNRVLTPNQRDTYVDAGDDLDFPRVTSNFDTQGLKCDDIKYICAELSEDPRTTGDFDLEGVPNSNILRTCVELDCEIPTKSLIVVDVGIDLTGDDEVTEEEPVNPINFDVGVTSSPLSDDITGDDLWQMTAFTASDPQGKQNKDIVRQEVLSKPQRDQDLPSGSTEDFPGLTANVDMTGKYCNEVKYFCVELNKGVYADPSFIILGDPSDRLDCVPLRCAEAPVPPVVITDTDVDLSGDNMITAGDPYNPMEFDVIIKTDPNGGDAVGDDLWKATVFTSTTPDGSRNKRVLDEQVLTPSQEDRDIPAGDTATFRYLDANVDMQGSTCADVGYLCVEFSKGEYAYPDFEFSGSQSVRTDCIKLKCDEGNPFLAVRLPLSSNCPLVMVKVSYTFVSDQWCNPL